jgi:hypothetical protein
MEHRVKVRVLDWTDRPFVSALEIALVRAATECPVDSLAAALTAETALRLAGYPNASIAYDRSYDDLLHGLARWTVAREAPGDLPPNRSHA